MFNQLFSSNTLYDVVYIEEGKVAKIIRQGVPKIKARHLIEELRKSTSYKGGLLQARRKL